MEKFTSAMSVMLVLFIIVAIGFVARKKGLLDDHFDDVLSRVIMTITCPCIILDSVLSNTNLPDSEMVWLILGVSVLMFIPVSVVAWVVPMLYPIPKDERGGHQFTICFSNVGFLGFVVVAAILGSNSVLYVAIYNLVTNLVIYSVGAMMVANSSAEQVDLKSQVRYMVKSLISPVMAACVIALVLALLRITDDGVIGQTCSMLGAMTPPAVMLVIGSKMAKYEIREMISSPWAYVTTFVRLIVIPAITYAVGIFFIHDAYIVASITIVAAMPAAMVGTVMCVLYGGNLKPFNQGMFLSVLFSIITIPLVTMFIA